MSTGSVIAAVIIIIMLLSLSIMSIMVLALVPYGLGLIPLLPIWYALIYSVVCLLSSEPESTTKTD